MGAESLCLSIPQIATLRQTCKKFTKSVKLFTPPIYGTTISVGEYDTFNPDSDPDLNCVNASILSVDSGFHGYLGLTFSR